METDRSHGFIFYGSFVQGLETRLGSVREQ
jgi:hypothetical protein